MNYLLYGTEQYLIDQEVQKIILNNKIDQINVVKYDLAFNTMSKILDDCQTISLFCDNKAIVVDNSIIFNRVKTEENDINNLISYLNNSNPNTYLIFINSNNTIDNTKKITKLIKEKGIVKEFNNKNINDVVTQMFDNYKIDRNTISLLIERVGDDLTILSQEISKIKIYKGEDLVITANDILDLTVSNIDMDIFKFIDNIINKNKELSIITYREMLKNNEEPVKIIGLLASKFRLMYQTSELSRMGYSQQDISDTLNTHIYPVKLAISAGLKYKPSILLKYIENIADLDLNIKSGIIDAGLGLELFILNV